MLIFCPTCGNRLLVKEDGYGFALKCQTCPHKSVIRETLVSVKYSKLKEVDDVLNDSDTWKNVDVADEKCPKCEHPKANFMQIQIRSADEPSTTIYRCCGCEHVWKEN